MSTMICGHLWFAVILFIAFVCLITVFITMFSLNVDVVSKIALSTLGLIHGGSVCKPWHACPNSCAIVTTSLNEPEKLVTYVIVWWMVGCYRTRPLLFLYVRSRCCFRFLSSIVFREALYGSLIRILVFFWLRNDVVSWCNKSKW